MGLLDAIILGIVEGITEFLPISSTGHLIIAGHFLGINNDFAKTFEIFIQLGAILAVLWLYRKKFTDVIKNAKRDRYSAQFIFNLAIAFIPAAVLGVIFHDAIKKYLFNPFTVSIALIGVGLIIIWAENHVQRRRIRLITDVDLIPGIKALKIGIAQSFALIPGVSRSGATIISGILLGLDRKTATEFSFFLAVPTMLAATLFDLLKSLSQISLNDMFILAVGFITSFISALIVIKAFLKFISHSTFKPFAYYRIFVGVIFLIMTFMGILK